MKRVFVAINLPDNIKIILNNILVNLRTIYRGAPIRFVGTHSFHITLHFLGDQNDEMIDKVSRVLDEVAKQYQSIKLTLGNFGFFPNEIQPRVLWIGGEGSGKKTLENLQKDLGGELQKLKIQIDQRAWHPHITLGRISGKIATSMIESMKMPDLEWEVGSLELEESILKPQGAEYKILYTAKFK